MDFSFLTMIIFAVAITGASRIFRAMRQIAPTRKLGLITIGAALLINVLMVKWSTLSFDEGAFIFAFIAMWTLLGCFVVDQEMFDAIVPKRFSK